MAEAPQYDTHVVIADFEGTAENELTIKVGEKLLVLQSTPEGWSEGYTTDQRQGWFPSAYAKLDPVGRGDVMEEIQAANKTQEESSSQQQSQQDSPGGTSSTSSSGSSGNSGMSMQAAVKKNKMSSSSGGGPSLPGLKKKKKQEKADNPFPGIRRHDTTQNAGAFPGIRHHEEAAASPFPGIRHNTVELDEKEEKRKKAEEKKKAKEEKKKEKERQKDLRMAASGLFGVPLKAAVVAEQHDTSIPFIVRACVEHILKGKNLLREGLFRISGIKTEIDSLKASFEAGVEQDCLDALAKADIDAVAGVLKLYLRELPDPLFTYKFHSKFVKAGTDQNLHVIKATLGQLPPGHKETLLLLLGFLLKLSEYQELNKMTETNIGIVFAPTIMKCPTDDENDDPEALKEAFFYCLQQSSELLKGEPKIEKLLNQYYDANTCAGGSESLSNSGSSSSNMAPPPPSLGSGASNPNVSSTGLPPPIQDLPPPIS
uniref:Rho-GAP domain-containing protein n=1 Tax=Paramoeba aestuarina TaxID=180227 RepID=A0A6U3BYV3_9EUKA|eukprot:CAMPEP_0201523866 /NCGR_PEP_ID=MMETSP0161_2-20130828/20975_1 /ASSEMBLY_ACC=CAM_ASM_000251 /TAXON_ID=180227 /ORGANISM="Neoparamoeba aestuarina, Strain SoJaBio B1-5/56/2" /LENGTH=484 /DNA_ID=CAMNT_0047923097 /DNA_START=146 /DNA_END=1600 /DNA_ORIENTATION=-